MKKSKFSEEQIATALRQLPPGHRCREVTRKLGISEATYYVWRKKYGQIAVSEIRRLRQLESENGKLKQLVADLQEVLAKKGLRPTRKRALVRILTGHFAIGVRRACGLLRLKGASWYYRHHGRDDTAMRKRLRELAQARPRFGYISVCTHAPTRRQGGEPQTSASHLSGRKADRAAHAPPESARVTSGSCLRARMSGGVWIL